MNSTMKKTIYIYLILLSLFLSACSQKEEFEGIRPDARLAEVVAEYEAQLASAEYGWIGYLYPAGGGGYTFKFDFDGQNRVWMYASHRAEYATTARESSYRLRAAQVPSLYFDTYSYIHELADPDPSVIGGTTGQGLLSDFEFSILSVSPDTLRLKGNLNASELVLIRATAQQGDGYMERVYAQRIQLEQIATFPYYYNQLTTGGLTSHNVTINPERGTISFYSQLTGSTTSVAYGTTEDGLVLQTPYQDELIRVEALRNMTIDLGTHQVTAQLPDGTAFVTQNVSAPIAVDQDAAKRMYTAIYQYYSPTGFRFNGVEDGLDLASIPGYVGMTYNPRQYIDGYDAFFIYWNNGANYIGPALNTQLVDDGRAIFYNVVGYGQNGTTGLTQDHVNLINTWVSVLVNAQGYYVYQTAENAYDLVSVADARLWVRFR